MSTPQSGTAALRAVATDARPQRTIFDFLEHPKVKMGLAHVAGKFLTPDRMLTLCVNAVKKTPLLLQCEPQSVLGAMMASAALGLEPNTVQQQAFLIPYKQNRKVGDQWVSTYECQFQVGYRGFITLGYRSPYIDSMSAEAIHKGDHFKPMQGSKVFLEYIKSLEERGPLVGAFSHVALKNGRESMCVLPLEEVMKIRGRSETFRALLAKWENASSDGEKRKAQQKLDDTPWVLWEDDMAAKSAIKKHAKGLPIASSDALIAAASIDDKSEILDLKQMADPDAVKSMLQDGAEPPALDHNPSETFSFPEEDEREPEPAQRGQQQATAQAKQQAQQAQDWEPSAEEKARITERERQEAAGQQQGSAPAPTTRRGGSRAQVNAE